MKRKWVIRITLGLVLIITAISLFNNLTISHTDAQGIVNNSIDEIANSHVEIIRITYPDDRITIHIRDRRNSMDVNMEYADKELILQKFINNEEINSQVVSIGKDFNSGELVGSTWSLTEQASREIKAELKNSIVEESMIKLQANEWKSVSEVMIQGKKADKVKSEQLGSIQFAYFDYQTGVPVKQEHYNRDQMGNPLPTPEWIEEYSYFEVIPAEYLNTKQVVIKKGPASIQLDIAN